MAAEPTDVLGPVDFLVVEFPGGVVGGDGFNRLLSLVDTAVIRVLDLEFVARRADGSIVSVKAADVAVTDASNA